MASDIPGVSVKIRIEPDLEDPALHRLVVDAQLQSIGADLYFDNRGVEQSGPLQVFSEAALHSGLRPGDRLGGALFFVPDSPKEFAMAEASYLTPLDRRSNLSLSAALSRWEANGPSLLARSHGDMESFNARYSHALQRRRGAAVWLDGGLQIKSVENIWAGQGAYHDELRVARVGLRGFIRDDAGSLTYGAEISRGLGVLGASKKAPGLRSRFDASGEFTKIRIRTSYYRDLGRYFGVYAALEGQISSAPLLGSEEFSAGGPLFGRAYDYGEISGDHGVSGAVELRAGIDPGLDPISFVQSYVFYDAAAVWNFNAPGDPRSLASAGAGVRISFDKGLTARLEAAKPLTRTPFTQTDKDWRPFFSLSAWY